MEIGGSHIVLKPYERIENTHFGRGRIVIRQQDFDGVRFVDGRITFSFINCTFNKLEIINVENIAFQDISVQFFNCNVSDIEVWQIVSENISIHFGSSIVSGNISAKKLQAVNFNNSIVKDSFFLKDIHNIGITYTEENIFVVGWNKLLKDINSDYMTILQYFQKLIIINPVKVYVKFNELKSSKKEKRGFYKEKKLTAKHDNEKDLKYSLPLNEKQLLNINLYIDFKDSPEGINIDILNSYLNSLTLLNNIDGNLNIENTKVNSIYLDRFSCEKASFYKISPFSGKGENFKISVNTSNLENVSFEKVRFVLYSVVSFYRTNFEGAKFITCDFPTKPTDFDKFKSLENVHYPDLVSENYYDEIYEIYIQIKSIIEKSGNSYEAQKMNAVASESLRKTKNIGWWDKRILDINSWSNYHGLSVSRPLGWFLLLSIILYVIYLYSLDRIFNSNPVNWDLFGYYFSFIDITHRNDFLVDKSEFNAGMLITDYFNKILTGFFIYQFIASFRKYGKK